jgi:hypothetical protein
MSRERKRWPATWNLRRRTSGLAPPRQWAKTEHFRWPAR